MPILVFLFVLFTLGVGAIVYVRGGEIFALSVRDGRLLQVRGRIPAALFHDLQDVVKRARVRRASIRAVRAEGGARLVARGVDERVAQRLRNTLGVHPIAQLSRAPAMKGRNLGHLLGFAWLVWLLDRR